MALDINNVQQRCGRPVRRLHKELNGFIGDALRADGVWTERTWNKNGRWFGDHKETDLDLVPISAKESAQPEIDWTQPVQIRAQVCDTWEDFTCLHICDENVYGYRTQKGAVCSRWWRRSEWQFRNTPVETWRVRGWINIYPSRWCSDLWKTKEKADSACSEQEQRIACVYIDVPAGHGLY